LNINKLNNEEKAIKHEGAYYNIYEQQVSWDFVEAVDCFCLFDEEIKSGTEVYSCFHKAPKSMSTEEFIDNDISICKEGVWMARHL